MAEKLIIEKIGTDKSYDIIIVDQTIRRTSAIDFVKSLKFKVNEKMDSYIQIRVTAEEKEQLKEMAKKKGTTVTNLIKTALNEYLK